MSFTLKTPHVLYSQNTTCHLPSKHHMPFTLKTRHVLNPQITTCHLPSKHHMSFTLKMPHVLYPQNTTCPLPSKHHMSFTFKTPHAIYPQTPHVLYPQNTTCPLPSKHHTLTFYLQLNWFCWSDKSVEHVQNNSSFHEFFWGLHISRCWWRFIWSQCRKNIWIVPNSDSDLVTSCFTCIFIGITRSLPLCFVLCSLAALINLQVVLEVVVTVLNVFKTCQLTRASTRSAEVSEYVLRLKGELTKFFYFCFL